MYKKCPAVYKVLIFFYKFNSLTADSDAQVGLGIPLSFTKPSLSGHFLYTGRYLQAQFRIPKLRSPRYMISTRDYNLLPNRERLQTICKAISVLDAIISQEWEYRYYSYNKKWSDNEEFCEMRNGSGDQMLILFRQDGCVINGFAHEFEQQDKAKLTNHLPSIFDEFIFGEPVKSIGTTFCLWTIEQSNWQVGQIENYTDNSEEMLNIFDGNPETYINWASEYFEESYIESGIPLNTVSKIYNGQTLTKEMILTIVEDVEDWEQLEADLNEIGYPYNFEKSASR